VGMSMMNVLGWEIRGNLSQFISICRLGCFLRSFGAFYACMSSMR